MSVIRYVSEEEEINGMEKEEQTQSNEPIIMQQPPKLRVAVCGPAKAGKTYLLNAIRISLA